MNRETWDALTELLEFLDNQQDGAEDASALARKATVWHPALASIVRRCQCRRCSGSPHLSDCAVHGNDSMESDPTALCTCGAEGETQEPAASAVIQAAECADWMQVVLNQGPPCFHLEDDNHFCFRAERWAGHGSGKGDIHPFVSLADLIRTLTAKSKGGGR